MKSLRNSRSPDLEMRTLKYYLLREGALHFVVKKTTNQTKTFQQMRTNHYYKENQSRNSHGSAKLLNHCPLVALLLARYQLITGHLTYWQAVKRSLLTSDSFND